MKTKFLFILLFIGVIVLTAFVTNKKSSKPEYALLRVNNAILNKQIYVLYDNGYSDDLTEILKLKLSADLNNDFPEIAKTFKYLNEKGYKMIAPTYMGNGPAFSYMFIKE